MAFWVLVGHDEGGTSGFRIFPADVSLGAADLPDRSCSWNFLFFLNLLWRSWIKTASRRRRIKDLVLDCKTRLQDLSEQSVGLRFTPKCSRSFLQHGPASSICVRFRHFEFSATLEFSRWSWSSWRYARRWSERPHFSSLKVSPSSSVLLSFLSGRRAATPPPFPPCSKIVLPSGSSCPSLLSWPPSPPFFPTLSLKL